MRKEMNAGKIWLEITVKLTVTLLQRLMKKVLSRHGTGNKTEKQLNGNRTWQVAQQQEEEEQLEEEKEQLEEQQPEQAT